jgi:hypothetical protein
LKRKNRTLKKEMRSPPKIPVTRWDMNWEDFLNEKNNGHSETILGIVVDWDGNPITGRR